MTRQLSWLKTPSASNAIARWHAGNARAGGSGGNWSGDVRRPPFRVATNRARLTRTTIVPSPTPTTPIVLSHASAWVSWPLRKLWEAWSDAETPERVRSDPPALIVRRHSMQPNGTIPSLVVLPGERACTATMPDAAVGGKSPARQLNCPPLRSSSRSHHSHRGQDALSREHACPQVPPGGGRPGVGFPAPAHRRPR